MNSIRRPSIKPYLLQAFYEWINDGGYTPYLVINSWHYAVSIPKSLRRQSEQLLINISPYCVADFTIHKQSGIVAFESLLRQHPGKLSLPIESIDCLILRHGHDEDDSIIVCFEDIMGTSSAEFQIV